MRNHIMNANNKAVRRAVGAGIIGAALVGAVAMIAGNPAFAADEKKKNTVSKELAKTLKEASDAVNGKKYNDALAKLKDAEANPKKTPKPKPGRTPVNDERRRTSQAADRSVRHAGHHGGRQREEGRRARSLEGQRHG